MNTKKHSERNDLIPIYLRNVWEIYEQYMAAARVVKKRRGLPKKDNDVELKDSEMVKSLSRRLNLYSLKYDGIRCVEEGDYEIVAQCIEEEADEL